MEIFAIETAGAGLRVTLRAGRVELAVTAGAATFGATLTRDQAEQLALALLRATPVETEPRTLRAVPRRVDLLEGA